MRFLIALLLMISFVVPIFAESQQLSTDKGTLNIKIETDPDNPIANEQTKIKISFINPKTNSIQEHVDYKVEATNAQKVIFGPIPLTHTAIGTGTIPMTLQDGENKIKIDVEGIVFNPIPPESATFSVFVKGASTDTSSAKPKSGCLIATAALGTELAPQVQMLREIRDNVLFKTNSGTAFMTGFDQFYYTFSPTIADWERQNPLLKETVRVAITPMLSTLSIMQNVHANSESQVLGYGIGIIALNAGIYFVLPAIIIARFRR